MSEKLIKQIPAHRPNKYQKEQIERAFGMFIHFGVNTFGNVEWSDGSIPALCYKPETVDADQWIRTAYEAGMNYVIITTKHHGRLLSLGHRIHGLLREELGKQDRRRHGGI